MPLPCFGGEHRLLAAMTTLDPTMDIVDAPSFACSAEVIARASCCQFTSCLLLYSI